MTCLAQGCSTRYGKDKSLFRLPNPKKKRELCNQWLSKLGIASETFVWHKKKLVCQDHFEQDSFSSKTTDIMLESNSGTSQTTNYKVKKLSFFKRNDERARLKRNAVPTLNLTAEPGQTYPRRPKKEKKLIKCVQPDEVSSEVQVDDNDYSKPEQPDLEEQPTEGSSVTESSLSKSASLINFQNELKVWKQMILNLMSLCQEEQQCCLGKSFKRKHRDIADILVQESPKEISVTVQRDDDGTEATEDQHQWSQKIKKLEYIESNNSSSSSVSDEGNNRLLQKITLTKDQENVPRVIIAEKKQTFKWREDQSSAKMISLVSQGTQTNLSSIRCRLCSPLVHDHKYHKSRQTSNKCQRSKPLENHELPTENTTPIPKDTNGSKDSNTDESSKNHKIRIKVFKIKNVPSIEKNSVDFAHNDKSIEFHPSVIDRPLSSTTNANDNLAILQTVGLNTSTFQTAILNKSTLQTVIPNTSTLQTVLLNKSTPNTSTLQTDRPNTSTLQTDRPNTSTLQTVIPNTSTLQTVIPNTSTLQTDRPNTSTLQTVIPNTSTLQTVIPNTSTLQTDRPNTSTLQTVIPNTSTLQTVILNKSTSNISTLQTDRTNNSTLQTVIPNTSTLQAVRPKTLTLQSVRSNTSTLQTVRPNTLTLQTVRPNTSTLQTVRPNTSTLQTVRPNTSTLQTVRPNTSTLQTVRPNKSTLQIVRPNTSTLQTVRPNTSTLQTVIPNTSTLQTVRLNTSTLQTVVPNTSTLKTVRLNTSTLQTVIPNTSTLQTVIPNTSTFQTDRPNISTLHTLGQSISALQTATLKASTLQTSTENASALQIVRSNTSTSHTVGSNISTSHTVGPSTSTLQTVGVGTLLLQSIIESYKLDISKESIKIQNGKGSDFTRDGEEKLIRSELENKRQFMASNQEKDNETCPEDNEHDYSLDVKELSFESNTVKQEPLCSDDSNTEVEGLQESLNIKVSNLTSLSTSEKEILCFDVNNMPNTDIKDENINDLSWTLGMEKYMEQCDAEVDNEDLERQSTDYKQTSDDVESTNKQHVVPVALFQNCNNLGLSQVPCGLKVIDHQANVKMVDDRSNKEWRY